MTITIKRSTAVLAIALIAALGGFCIGQVTTASSAPEASVSYTAPFEQTLKSVDRNLKAIKQMIGPSYVDGTILNELDRVKGNTYGTCQNTGGSAFCHNDF